MLENIKIRAGRTAAVESLNASSETLLRIRLTLSGHEIKLDLGKPTDGLLDAVAVFQLA